MKRPARLDDRARGLLPLRPPETAKLVMDYEVRRLPDRASSSPTGTTRAGPPEPGRRAAPHLPGAGEDARRAHPRVPARGGGAGRVEDPRDLAELRERRDGAGRLALLGVERQRAAVRLGRSGRRSGGRAPFPPAWSTRRGGRASSFFSSGTPGPRSVTVSRQTAPPRRPARGPRAPRLLVLDRVERVADEVQDDLLDARGVELRGRAAGVRREVEADPPLLGLRAGGTRPPPRAGSFRSAATTTRGDGRA